VIRRLSTTVIVASMALPIVARSAPAPSPKKPAPSASVSAAPSASTPPPPPATPEELEGRRHFETGLKLYKEKLYEAALVEFEQSYKIIPRPSALRNVAQCQRDLKRFAEAYGAYERLLSLHLAQMTPAETAAVKKALKDLESVTGVVTVDVNEPGATVSVDGRDVGQTPLSGPVRVDVGPHNIRVIKSGYESFEQSIKVLAMQSLSVDAKLVKDIKTGKVTIKDKAGGNVHVFVDDVDRGAAPVTVELSPGAHIVELRGEGLFSARKTIEVVAKTEGEVVLEATALRGHLRVETFGKKGTIYVDGQKKGDGLWEGDLAPGTHRVKVVAAGYDAHERLIAIEHGQSVVEAVTLVASAKVGPTPVLPPPIKDPYLGLYGRLSLMGAFSTSGAGEELRPLCDASRPCTPDSSKPIGGGTSLHVGYSFGILAAEFVGVFMADYNPTKRTYTGQPGTAGFPTGGPNAPAGTMARAETWDLWSMAAYTGLGGRITSKDDAVRFTLGLSIGHVYRQMNMKRSTLDDGWRPSGIGYSAFGMYGDAGLLLGNTPGFKLSIGVSLWLDFPSGVDETESVPEGRVVSGQYSTGNVVAKLESPSQQLRSGTQIYIGPTLGFQFGR
jgi:hypothetical protein